MKFSIHHLAVACNGDLASAFEPPQERALARDAGAAISMIEKSDEVVQFPVVDPAFYTERALADSRQADPGVDVFRHVLGKPEPLDPCCSKDDGIELAFLELPEPRVHVPAQLMNHEVRAHVHELGLAPEAARTNIRSFGQVFEHYFIS